MLPFPGPCATATTVERPSPKSPVIPTVARIPHSLRLLVTPLSCGLFDLVIFGGRLRLQVPTAPAVRRRPDRRDLERTPWYSHTQRDARQVPEHSEVDRADLRQEDPVPRQVEGRTSFDFPPTP